MLKNDKTSGKKTKILILFICIILILFFFRGIINNVVDEAGTVFFPIQRTIYNTGNYFKETSYAVTEYKRILEENRKLKNENVKPSKNSEKNYYAGYTMNSANKFKNVSDYSKYLTNKYKCLTPCKNASVLIDGSVMQKACGDEKTAKWLEENLAIMPDVIRNAQKAAISHGSKLISVEFKFTNNGTEMTTCGIFGETGTDSEIDKWLERMKEDKEKEDKKTENMIAIEATTKNKVGFDTYA